MILNTYLLIEFYYPLIYLINFIIFLDENKKIKKYIFFIFITILSTIYIYFFLYFERRIIGISPQYHPDSVYYFENFSRYTNYLSN